MDMYTIKVPPVAIHHCRNTHQAQLHPRPTTKKLSPPKYRGPPHHYTPKHAMQAHTVMMWLKLQTAAAKATPYPPLPSSAADSLPAVRASRAPAAGKTALRAPAFTTPFCPHGTAAADKALQPLQHAKHTATIQATPYLSDAAIHNAMCCWLRGNRMGLTATRPHLRQTMHPGR